MAATAKQRRAVIGLMSGTSLDGVDAVAMTWYGNGQFDILGHHFLPYDNDLRRIIIDLQHVGHNELATTALLANSLATLYAQCVHELLIKHDLTAANIAAIGCHGQTIRHAPQDGYTLQVGNLALLAELTNIDVIGDFRTRDVAAGGEGAPLVPAFHRAIFSHPTEKRVILNIGGIANLSKLHPNQTVIGFDTGPGNMLMDAWIQAQKNERFDDQGRWASTGQVHMGLLAQFLKTPYFSAPIPKSTGRDLFHLPWLQEQLAQYGQAIAPEDVQATLMALTTHSIAQAIHEHAPGTEAVFACGGGTENQGLLDALAQALSPITLHTTADLGLDDQWVEAAAFAWLAQQFIDRQTSNLPEVTGAIGPRLLGALYPK